MAGTDLLRALCAELADGMEMTGDEVEECITSMINDAMNVAAKAIQDSKAGVGSDSDALGAARKYWCLVEIIKRLSETIAVPYSEMIN